MPKYLTVHHETSIDRLTLETRWSEIATETRADWQMTLFNVHEGKRFCEWDAPSAKVIEEILRDLGVKWSDIVPVEVTAASDWSFWEVKTRPLVRNCWEVLECGREPGGGKANDRGICPVAEDRRLWGKNRGLYAGRCCWNVLGTMCAEGFQETFEDKIRVCGTCGFYEQVKHEERARFQP